MKKTELNKLSTEDLRDKLGEAQKDLQTKRFSHKANPIANPMEIKFIRRDIARLQTELSKRK